MGPEEPERWRQILRRMTVPFHDGVISQFEDYETLEEFDWEGYRARHGDISRLDRILKAEGDTPDRYRLSKQADVLMLYYLLTPADLARILARLGYDYSDDLLRRTIDYYLPRTTHGSTLSFVVHASVMDRIERDVAWEMFREALRSDIEDVQGGTTPEGIHMGAMGGTVDIVMRHYAGIETGDGVIGFSPRLPAPLASLRLRVLHRGRWYGIAATHDRFALEVEEGPPGTAPVRILGHDHLLAVGDRVEVDLPEG